MESSKTSKFSSLGSQFKSLSTMEPHYIPCMKPNNLFKPEIFDNINILHQLRESWKPLESVVLGKPFNEFLTRIKILAPVTTKEKIGKTKVFLRAGQMAELDAHRDEVLGHSACLIQRKVLSYESRKHGLMSGTLIRS
ncbi:unnamed protein product [Arabis nemorensis]|uniref:Myosin motor domain-containing protein n=1 Tax=Arabis nemorensis TaxID=586526 RepID=A0A565CCF0_9BRAS|nr:unnamed protein product [Arabis nemorensis]